MHEQEDEKGDVEPQRDDLKVEEARGPVPPQLTVDTQEGDQEGELGRRKERGDQETCNTYGCRVLFCPAGEELRYLTLPPNPQQH